MSSPQRSPSPLAWLYPALALLVGVLGAAAVWLAIFLALRSGDWRWCAWLAPLVAIDIALMLRLAAAPAGQARAGVATLATAAAVALSLWMLAATEMARVIGISPLESALRLGPTLAADLLRNGFTVWDWIWLALALPLAWRLAR